MRAFVPFQGLNTHKNNRFNVKNRVSGELCFLLIVFSSHAFKQGFAHFVEIRRRDVA